ncbi:MAG: ROK family protein, partial [Euryarchaeota archaeon]|nr:ROK family protein [Euryarchaeota archaeon]
MVRYAIGIDIGRTNLRAVMMDSRGKVIESIKEPTNVSGDYDSVVKQSASVAKRISDN